MREKGVNSAFVRIYKKKHKSCKYSETEGKKRVRTRKTE